jgi:hypothetical protein
MQAANQAETGNRLSDDERRFFRTLATVMAIVQVTGFVFQYAMGRSSFDAPLFVHAHAVVFMGWVAIFTVQPWLANAGASGWHRTVGRVAMVWACGLLVFGLLVTWETVRTGRTPFFFQPQHFLLANPLTLFGALGLLAAAISLRKHQDWHPRLQIGSFVLLMGPGFGRLLPMPFLPPHAFEIASVAALVFVAVAAGRDLRHRREVHPAWAWTVLVLLGSLLLARALAVSPVGEALHAAAVSGTAAEGSDGMAFPPPPPGN